MDGIWARTLLEPIPHGGEHDGIWVLGTIGIAIAGVFAWLASLIAIYQVRFGMFIFAV